MLSINDIVKLNLNIGTTTLSETAYECGLIIGSSTVITTTARLKKYSSLEAVAADTFATSSDEYKAAAKYFAQNPAPAALYIGVKGENETLTEALGACLEKSGSFWGVYACNAVKADIVAMDALLKTEKRGLLFASVTGENPASVDGIFASLQTSGSNRTMATYVTEDSDSAAIMGLMCGLFTAHKNDAFTLCYKTVEGITAVDATKTTVDDIKELNGNVYVTRGYEHDLLENATTGSGLRVDEVLYLDSILGDLQNEVFNVMSRNTAKLPQTDETTTIFMNAMTGVLEGYYSRGIIAPGTWRGNPIGSVKTGDTIPHGYAMYADSFANQTQADREAKKAMPITIALTLAGTVESVELSVYVQR